MRNIRKSPSLPPTKSKPGSHCREQEFDLLNDREVARVHCWLPCLKSTFQNILEVYPIGYYRRLFLGRNLVRGIPLCNNVITQEGSWGKVLATMGSWLPFTEEAAYAARKGRFEGICLPGDGGWRSCLCYRSWALKRSVLQGSGVGQTLSTAGAEVLKKLHVL